MKLKVEPLEDDTVYSLDGIYGHHESSAGLGKTLYIIHYHHGFDGKLLLYILYSRTMQLFKT